MMNKYMTTSQKIFISAIALIFIGSLAVGGYSIYKIKQFERVLNAQGSAIRLIVETPEINAVVLSELQRRQGIQPAATNTPEQ
jgi:hypothetical protein